MTGPFGAFSLPEQDRRYLAGEIRAGRVCYAQALPSSAQAYLALGLHHALAFPFVWAVESPKALDTLYQNLVSLGGVPDPACVFPAIEDAPARAPRLVTPDAAGERIRALQQCLQPARPVLLVTCVQALLQPAPHPSFLRAASETLRAGQETDPEALVARLEKMGYSFEAEVVEKGQAARRGGLLDVWSPTEPWPVRLEFLGDILESIRAFDPSDQRSIEKRAAHTLSPARESAEESAAGASLLDYLPRETQWVWVEPDRLWHHAEMFAALTPGAGSNAFQRLRLRVERTFSGGQLVLGLDREQSAPAHALDLRPCEGLPALEGGRLQPDALASLRAKFVDQLRESAAAGGRVYVFFSTDGSRERFEETHRERGGIRLLVGPLSEGFTSAALRLRVIAESDLYGFRKTLPGRHEAARLEAGGGARVDEWSDLQPGEFVVHHDHGIGRYLGLYEIDFNGRRQEALAVEYAEKARLYVPVAQSHMLTRYVGIGRRRPELHALGGRRWMRERAAAERAVQDLAAVLLQTQAKRSLLDGHAFPPDVPWQHEFEASFPYPETPDQHRAVAEVKGDLQARKPMDRLICGDVGYGKTEVAMRAAFKAVMDGRQVAVLVPTTVLAQQHYDTFTERMAAYPVAIEMLSRFRTRGEQQEIARRVADGAVDIVIGTHRLLQDDVRFRDLGLVIIDEEQRFGVAHKEHLKHVRELVDVLTLTATPIPRTLYMSLTGAKDMSTIQTAPRERLPIETIVAQDTDDLVRGAVLHEINRGGQVFYLHNRVMTIRHVQDRLRRIVPEARVEVAHGQMPEQSLADVMRRFVRGGFDVLLCTTIIESGVDIPNVNTILIDRADRFGLADLYQLRGRVGRYKHKAYAYLLLPRHGRLFDSARQRIGAIQRYSSLGACFKLALRDLEIRGAGNLLGAEQSGHIAAVGFDLYCQLLKRTVARLGNQPLPPIVDVELRLDFIDLSPAAHAADSSTVIPPGYIEDESLRVEFYRKIASASTEADVDALCAEARDRYGPLPPSFDRLLKAARLRIVAAAQSLRSVETQEGKVMMMRGRDYLTRDGRFPRLTAPDASGRLDELIRLARTWA